MIPLAKCKQYYLPVFSVDQKRIIRIALESSIAHCVLVT